MSIETLKISDISYYTGEYAIPGIRFRAVRDALGVTAWGMNVMELDPGCDGHPRHDHTHDGQEEVYVVLEGSIVLLVDGTERTLTRGMMVRVPPETTRQFVTRGEGATVLAIGGTPGKAYAPDPRMAT